MQIITRERVRFNIWEMPIATFVTDLRIKGSNSLIFNFANKNEYGKSTFKVLFYVNGSKEKDGIVPIMGRVTINGTVAQFSCADHRKPFGT